MAEPILEFDHVSKRFDNQMSVDDISFQVNEGEFFVLVGASGSGKTTTLRMINRLIDPSSGLIKLRGKNSMDYNLRELRMSIGYVLQGSALFPNMTVQQNITLIPEMRGQSSKTALSLAEELLQEVDMDPKQYLSKYPKELSGGEQQRIGILRAFAANPQLILMDEPFSALDPIARRQLRSLVKQIHENTNSTIVL
ncbi:ATP-binding cassette domain-containing protein [Lentilactobacillus kosonis]|uniref:L-proline glycine betaine ABC transport system permease protein proV n=1 Tax=Lentilactobacillus kosonis TaxID=2810561 RepID=A0A401FMI6_9LACO|nr:ATP-binding cassette domain-containing protein [Lentilactobacillus kosonis]GAY73590.1 L-proline glycine betaine ABC transport system permease protein proV [Lentilactobacillus kosonis]